MVLCVAIWEVSNPLLLCTANYNQRIEMRYCIEGATYVPCCGQLNSKRLKGKGELESMLADPVGKRTGEGSFRRDSC